MQLISYLTDNNLYHAASLPTESGTQQRPPCCGSSPTLYWPPTLDASLLGLLDLTAAFDCVDHCVLLQLLERTYGLEGDVLSWITSFLVDRTAQVGYDGRLSSTRIVWFVHLHR